MIDLGVATLDILICLREIPLSERTTCLCALAVLGGGPVATVMVSVARQGIAPAFVGAMAAIGWAGLQ